MRKQIIIHTFVEICKILFILLTPMKKTRIFCLLLLWMCCFTAVMAKYKPVVWEHPAADGVCTSGLSRITITVNRVEMTADETVVELHVKFIPNNWVRFVKDTYLLADGKRYVMTGSEGIKPDENFYMPASGEADMTFRFPPLPEGTERFDFIEGDVKGAFELFNIRPRQENDTSVFPANWRSDETGEWLVGLMDEGAVYAGKCWEYKEKDGRRGRFVITDGDNELTVRIGKCRNGRAEIRIGGAKAVKCSRIDGKCLPAYPVADDRSGLKDNGYAVGDSVTVTGWLRETVRNRHPKTREMRVIWDDLFDNEQRTKTFAVDSLGRFRFTMPVYNTQNAFLSSGDVFMDMVLEPGETYFLLLDMDTGRRLVMGRDCRLQNEMLMEKVKDQGRCPELKGNDMTDADAEKYIEEVREYGRAFRARCDSVFAANPTLSERYRQYVLNTDLMDQAFNVGQARFRFPRFTMPKVIADYAYENYWKKLPVPYTAYGYQLRGFLRDYMAKAKYGIKAVVTMDEILKESDAILTAEEKLTVKAFLDKHAELMEAVKAAPERKKELEEKYEKDNEALTAKIKELLSNEKMSEVVRTGIQTKWTEGLRGVLDSLKAPQVLRDMILAGDAIATIDNHRLPLGEKYMADLTGTMQMPLAKEKVREKNDIYIALRNREIAANSRPRTSLDAKGVSDGEALLRKITEPFLGRAVLIDVWGTWCSPCKEGLKHSKEEYEALSQADVVYLYLANRSNRKSVENIIKEYGVEGPDVYHYNLPAEQQEAIERYLNVTSYPTYWLLDTEGNVLDVNADPRHNIDTLAKLLRKMSPKK